MYGRRLCVYEQGAKDGFPVDIPQKLGTGAFGVRHHTEYVSCFIADAGNISEGAIGVSVGSDHPMFVAIAIDHLSIGFQLVERLLIRIIAAFAMGNGDLEGLTLVSLSTQID